MSHFVRLATNGIGEWIDTFQLSDGVQLVDRQVVILGDESNYAARVRILNVEPATTDYGLPVREIIVGSNIYHVVSAAGVNAANIKGSAGRVTGWHIFNNAAYDVFVKLFDETTVPVPGTDTVKYTIKVPTGQDTTPLSDRNGIAFSTGIGIAITLQAADLDSTAVALGDCVVNLHYK